MYLIYRFDMELHLISFPFYRLHHGGKMKYTLESRAFRVENVIDCAFQLICIMYKTSQTRRDSDGVVTVWSLRTRRPLQSWQAHTGSLDGPGVWHPLLKASCDLRYFFSSSFMNRMTWALSIQKYPKPWSFFIFIYFLYSLFIFNRSSIAMKWQSPQLQQ